MTRPDMRFLSFAVLLSMLLAITGCGSTTPTQTTAPPAPQALSVSTASALPSGTVGKAYSVTLAASGGTSPYTWAVASGTLPAGLTLASSTGVISGTPTAAATSAPFTVSVTDSASPAASASLPMTLTIAAAASTLSITSTSLPNGTVGATYAGTLTASGGTGALTWSVTGGTLPAGLTLMASTGVIAGTPSAAVTNASITFTVTDSSTPAQSASGAVTLTIAAAAGVAPAITTTTLPNGAVGSPYTTTLVATGGTTPYSWTVTSGTLPAGLALNAATGVISGTPTAIVTASPVGFTLTDASAPPQTATVTLNFNIVAAGAINVTVNPVRAGLTVTQTLSLTATTSDTSAVNWSITPAGGSFSVPSTASGTAVVLTAPTTPGVYTVSATSVTDNVSVASTTVAVTNLGGVYTYHNDLNRDGVNASEYALTTATVTAATFGKLFSCTVDGAVYAQPLWVANLAINGGQHNVVFVATEHDGLYAIDADATPCTVLWHVNLVDTAHGAAAGETSVPWNLLGSGIGDIQPEVGVTGTPVIDPATNILYVVSKSTDTTQTTFPQRLHAINLFTGAEMAGSPITVAGTFPGTAEGTAVTTFNSKMELQRTGLALVNGVVYGAWSGHEDTPPYYGWMIGYAYNGGFTQTSIFNDDPNAHFGGIWMSGGAPAADGNGNLYALTGNGTFDVNTGGPDYGDSMLQMTPSTTAAHGITVTNYFTPSDQQNDQQNDNDFGAGGAAILADLPMGAPIPHLIMGGGKDGALYVLNRDTLGAYGDNTAWQKITFSHGIFSTGAFWNNNFYLRGSNGPLETYTLNVTTAMFSPGPNSSSNYGRFGATPSLSASGTTNGIVWDINAAAYCTAQSTATCGPAVLHAFDASNIATQLWTSADAANGADAAGFAVKFILPTVANGKVYVGTRGNNSNGTSTAMTIPGELDVYGLKPN